MKKLSKKVGLPPASLVYVGNGLQQNIQISMIEYDSLQLTIKDNISLDECFRYLQTPAVTWINICGIQDSDVLKAIGKKFGLHGLLLEDVMNTTQRPKLDNYKEHLFIVLRMLKFVEGSDKISNHQISIVLGKNYVISFLETCQLSFQNIRESILSGKEKIRSSGADYLCYSILDCIVDQYFLILEGIDDQLEGVEEALLQQSGPAIMRRIQHLKKEIILLRKSIWPTREVVNNFQKLDSPLISSTTKVYLQDLYDHTIQAIDTIESFRDISSGMLDIYLSYMSQRMNEIMKVLTVVSTLFVPLTFIASIYGMNFDNMPELHWKWGYPLTLCLMALAALGMLFFFRKKKWI